MSDCLVNAGFILVSLAMIAFPFFVLLIAYLAGRDPKPHRHYPCPEVKKQ